MNFPCLLIIVIYIRCLLLTLQHLEGLQGLSKSALLQARLLLLGLMQIPSLLLQNMWAGPQQMSCIDTLLLVSFVVSQTLLCLSCAVHLSPAPTLHINCTHSPCPLVHILTTLLKFKTSLLPPASHCFQPHQPLVSIASWWRCYPSLASVKTLAYLATAALPLKSCLSLETTVLWLKSCLVLQHYSLGQALFSMLTKSETASKLFANSNQRHCSRAMTASFRYSQDIYFTPVDTRRLSGSCLEQIMILGIEL